MARSNYDAAGDPASGSRDTDKFYAADAKDLAVGRTAVGTTTSSAIPAINTDDYGQFTITALATAITSMSSGLSGTPEDGQLLIVRIKDDGTPRDIAWGASWRGVGVTLPTKTIPTGTLYVEARYNSADSIWDVITVRKQVVPIQIVGSASATASSVTLPTHQSGDLIVIYAFNNASTALPTAPSASGTVPAFATVDSAPGNTCAGLLASFTATASNHTSGTWGNTTGIIAVVLRAQASASPVGGVEVAGSSASSSQAISPSITMSKTDGTSVLLYFYAHRTVTAWGSPPAGCTLLTKSDTSVLCNKKDDTTSDGAITQTLTGSAVGNMNAVLEILAST